MRIFKTRTSKQNLCDYCDFGLPTCPSPKGTHIKYGDSKGNDNIIECSEYAGKPDYEVEIGGVAPKRITSEPKWSNALNKKWYSLDEDGDFVTLADDLIDIEEVEKRLNESTEKAVRNANIIKKKDEQINKISQLLDGVFRYYHDTYKTESFEIDNSGRPVDPEYYIYKSLKKAETILKESEEMG